MEYLNIKNSTELGRVALTNNSVGSIIIAPDLSSAILAPVKNCCSSLL